MVDSVFDLDHPAARLAANAGGNGAALARMRNTGLPVPPGFIVSTEAFRSAGFTQPAWLSNQIASIDATNPQALDPFCPENPSILDHLLSVWASLYSTWRER